MSGIPNARSIADAMAENAAGYVLIAPCEHREAATVSVAEGFRDACIDHGIPINAGDVAYYVRVVTAKVAEMTPRLVELGLKAKK
jgi:ABC-type branched-subunit amino acid transport system substrate-binding protein